MMISLSSTFDPIPCPLTDFPFTELSLGFFGGAIRTIQCTAEPAGADDDEAGDEEDPAAAQPLAEEESSFDDFDDEFDDDFEEESNDPDWDHPGDAEPGPLPPSKGPGKKK